MMDNITLNISVKPAAIKSKQAQPQLKQKTMPRSRRPAPDNFDFQFNSEKPKIKAIAMRRRVVPKSTMSIKASTSAKPLTPSVIAAPVSSATVKLDGELLLNITTAPVSVTSASKPKPKATRAERLNAKRAERRGQGPKRVLTTQELDQGLKRQHVNPNKQPRAGDVFKAQLEKEREERCAAEQVIVEETTAVTTGKETETSAEKAAEAGKVKAANRFRTDRERSHTTKKVGLFDQSDVAALQQLGQRAVKPIKETIFAGGKVDSLGLHAHAVKNLLDLLSITELTTVQQKTIPEVLAGKDVLVRSQTGSGKTLAYALPIVERLQSLTPKIKRTDGVLALVIVPTRELAIQTYELFQKLVKPYTWIVPGALLGGESRKSEKARLRKGINVLLGTPGRLVDHLLHTASFRLSRLQFLVLDEADRLLELGYERDVKQVVEAIDKQRAELQVEEGLAAPKTLQRLLLSATLTAEVQKLAGLALHSPLYIDNSDEQPSIAITGTDGYQKEAIEAQAEDDGLGEYMEDVTGVLTIPENLLLSYVVVPPKLRLVTLAALMAKELTANPKQFKAMVFMSTMEMVNFHHDMLNEALTRRVLDEEDEEAAKEEEQEDEAEAPLLQGLRFFKLHGSMTQTERQGVFKSFRECSTGVLIATDVVGRGIDVPDVKLVVQYSPPQKTSDFVHRVGRTARAGRRGRAVLFLAPSEAQFVRHLEDKRIRIQQGDMYAYLQALVAVDPEARNVQEAASNLQHKFQELIEDDQELHDKSCKAFVSWMKFYTTFPKELKPIFNVKVAHMGHFAKSFGLKEAPTKFAKLHAAPKAVPATNRLTYTERDPEKMQQEKRNKRRLYTTTVSGEVRNSAQPATQQQRGPAGQAQGQRTSHSGGSRSSFMKSLSKSRVLNISEFDSGLSVAKKRKQS